MKRITIIQTNNGWLIVSGYPDYAFKETEPFLWSYDSIESAMAAIKEKLEAWHAPKDQTLYLPSVTKKAARTADPGKAS